MGLSQPKHRYIVLDSLRGVAASFVVLYHILRLSSFAPIPFVEHAWLFVDFFFVLSGFVIGFSYGKRLENGYSVGRYMIQRFFRVYPLHLFVLLIFMVFEIIFALTALGGASRQPFVDIYSVRSLVSSLFLVQIFVGPDNLPWNGPSWSIAAEFWTYLVFAMAMRLLPRFIVPLCLVAVVAVPIYLSVLTDRNISVFHDGALARCMFGFAAGVLCWKLPVAIRERTLPQWADHLLELGAVLLCIVFMTVAGVDRLSLVAPLVFAVTVSIFSRERGLVSRLLRSWPFVSIGNLSYSIYLIHWFLLWRFINVLQVAERAIGLDLVATQDGQTALTGSVLVQGAVTLIFYIGVVVVSYVTCKLIEKPGQRLGQKLLSRGGGHDVVRGVPAKI